MILRSRGEEAKSISAFNLDIFVTARRSFRIIPVLYFANKISNLLLAVVGARTDEYEPFPTPH